MSGDTPYHDMRWNGDLSDEKMQDSVGLHTLPALAFSTPYEGSQ